MKIRVIVLTLLACAELVKSAGAAKLELPKSGPLFSIELPDDWEIKENNNVVTAAPKGTDMIFSILPVPGATNLKEAMETMTKQTSANYDKIKVDRSSEGTEAGIRFIQAEGTARKGPLDFEMQFTAFSPDNAHYFGITLAVDAPSMQTQVDKFDRILESIRSFQEQASWMLFPKARPAFTFKIPPELWKEETEQGLTVRVRKESKEFFRIAEIPNSTGITTLDQATKWLKNQVTEQLQKTHAPVNEEFIFSTPCRGFSIRAGECETISFEDGNRRHTELGFFTLDEKRFFSTHYEQDYAEFEKEQSGGHYWWENVIASVKLPQK
ncbi:MAG: hypothetical protein QOH88_3650 [Verrucomicrobiota bacterium]